MPQQQQTKSNLKQFTQVDQKNANFLMAKFNPVMMATVPDLMRYYHNELQQRVQEITGASNSLFSSAAKVFRKIFHSANVSMAGSSNRISGFEIADFLPEKHNLSLVGTLNENPLKHSARMALVANIIKVRTLDVDQTRMLMMQAALPIALGSYHEESIKQLREAYEIYMHKLLMRYRKDMQKIRARMEGKGPKDSRLTPQLENYGKNELLLSMIKDKQEHAPVESEYFKSITVEQIQKAIAGKLDTGGGDVETAKKNLERNVIAIVVSLINIPFMHPNLIELVTECKKLRENSPVPDFLLGRLYMNQLRRSVTLEEVTQKARPQVQDRLKRTLTAYGHALKLIKNAGNDKVERQVFLGHASACLYAYNLKTLLGIPPPVLAKFLQTGKQSLEKSQLQIRNDKGKLYDRFMQAFNEQHMDWNIRMG